MNPLISQNENPARSLEKTGSCAVDRFPPGRSGRLEPVLHPEKVWTGSVIPRTTSFRNI